MDLLKKGFRKFGRFVFDLFKEIIDTKVKTITEYNDELIENSILKKCDIEIPYEIKNQLHYLTKMYLSHRFDLLGSGWIQQTYNNNPLGFEGIIYEAPLTNNSDAHNKNLHNFLLETHLKDSRYIYNLTTDNYKPIEWQKDFKSGYRWDVKKWYKRQKIAPKKGADIKVPWELARLQHLPQMAIYSHYYEKLRSVILVEFKNQVLDFIALNPPRLGCNWKSSMDVAIRAVNLLLAYDLFKKIDVNEVLDEKFIKLFTTSIYDHGKHISNNLEYSIKHSTNHYLANIAGLLFVSVYLPSNEETNLWLLFGIQELISEIKSQYYKDGGNFESSTCYHRLSTEIFIYSSALVFGLTDERKEDLKLVDTKKWKKFPKIRSLSEQEFDLNSKNIFTDSFIERLYRAGKFTFDITKPTGEVPQVGDNDNGRFVKLTPTGEFITNRKAEEKYLNLSGYCEYLKEYNLDSESDLYWDESYLNHQSLLSSYSGVFNINIFSKNCQNFPLERMFIEQLARGRKFLYIPVKSKNKVAVNLVSECLNLKWAYGKKIFPKFKKNVSLKEDIQLIDYPFSGIFVFKSKRIQLTVVATPVGQNGNGGHTHNDKLSFDLNIDGEDYYLDPGTYVYSPLIAKRNLFRSVKSHNVMAPNNTEQNDYLNRIENLFKIKDESRCELLDLSDNLLKLKLTYKDVIQVRTFLIKDDFIFIKDESNYELFQTAMSYYSNGYGKLLTKN